MKNQLGLLIKFLLLTTFLVTSTTALADAPGGSSLDQKNIATPQDTILDEGEQSVFRKVLWYIPNRLIDLVDIIKVDLGVGSAAGATLRMTRYGQMGGRYIDPASYRLGLRGRSFPMFIERESEYGFCGSFEQSSARHVTPLEIGANLDLGLGIYLGVSIDELADFFLGFVLLDIKEDDLVPALR